MLAVVEAGGVGYELRVPLSTLDALKGRQDVFLFTLLWVRQEDFRLFGFATRAERELFRLMLSVSGVGPSIALAALSTLAVEDLIEALANGDTVTIRRVKGIGNRLAERLALELKDRVRRVGITLRGESSEGTARRMAVQVPSGKVTMQDAVAALMELGFQRKAAEDKISVTFRQLRETAADSTTEISVEDLIREALR